MPMGTSCSPFPANLTLHVLNLNGFHANSINFYLRQQLRLDAQQREQNLFQHQAHTEINNALQVLASHRRHEHVPRYVGGDDGIFTHGRELKLDKGVDGEDAEADGSVKGETLLEVRAEARAGQRLAEECCVGAGKARGARSRSGARADEGPR